MIRTEFHKLKLTKAQFEDLREYYGFSVAYDYANRLDQHIASKGGRFVDHYATIKKWIAEDERKAEAE